jgi:AraC-like DNA-binding protein
MTPSFPALGDEHGESLFDSLDEVQFWVKDVGGRYLRVNRALVRNYGFPDSAAVLGYTDRELFPPHLAEQYVQDDREVLGGMIIRDRIELVGSAEPGATWHVTSKIPLRDRRGRIVATAGITRPLDERSATGITASALATVVERLRRDYAAPLDKRRLARLLKLSVRSLERRFVRAFGIGLLAYQRRLRMRRACEALAGGDESITSIALSLGYGDHSHFTREFRRLYGVPPRVYRRRWSRRGQESLPLAPIELIVRGALS